MLDDKIIIHCDGGARGNPGPAAAAFVVEDGGKVVYQESRFLGEKTNNSAEYAAVIIALEWLKNNFSTLGDSKIVFFLDSELVSRQLNRVYKVKEKNLKELFTKASSLIERIPRKIFFGVVPRERNRLADFLVNRELDQRIT